MRLFLTFALLAGLSAAQHVDLHSRVSVALNGMRENSWELRKKAFDGMPSLGEADKQDPSEANRLKEGLIQLLITENTARREFKRNGTVLKTQYYSEYYASLIGIVADLNDERSIPALVGAINTGDMATGALARFGEKSIGPILALLTADEDVDVKSSALFTIQELLAILATVSESTHARIKSAIGVCLKDPEYLVRYGAIRVIEYLEDREDFVPTLKEMANHDPGENIGTEHHSLRPAIQRLLQKIANREPAPTR